MYNFDWTRFTKKIAVMSGLATMYDAWTKPVEIEKWFLKTANFYDSNASLIDKNGSIEKGFTYEWSWHLYDAIERGKIVEVNGTDLIEFTFAGECDVVVKLAQQGEDVIVELTQSNIPTDEASKQNIRLGCASGWAFYMVNLKSVYEGGLDLRNKTEGLRGVVNS